MCAVALHKQIKKNTQTNKNKYKRRQGHNKKRNKETNTNGQGHNKKKK